MAVRSRHTPSQICLIRSEAIKLIVTSAAPAAALLIFVGDCEVHESAPDFFDGDARIPAPLRVGLDPRERAAQQLLTPQSRDDDETELGVYTPLPALVGGVVRAFVRGLIFFCHRMV